jgi:hypothetical protein
MAKPDRKFVQSLLATTGVTITHDVTTVKPVDVYYMHVDDVYDLEKSFVATLLLPPGNFLLVVQAVLHNYVTSSHLFVAQLTYPEDSDTVNDLRTGGLAPNDSPPYSLLMNCAVSVDSKTKIPVSLRLSSDAEAGWASAGEIKITAVRVGSLTTILKSA